MKDKLFRALITEFLGSFLIVSISCWSFKSLEMNKMDYSGLGAVNAFILAICTWAGFSTSGSHFNPVITLIHWMLLDFDMKKTSSYIFAQIAGSIFAALIVLMMTPLEYQQDDFYPSVSYPMILPLISKFQGLMMEMIMSICFVLVYFLTVVNKKIPHNMFGFALGGVILMGSVSIGPYTGACINPLRSLGPQIMLMNFSDSIIYWLGILSGSFFAAFYCTNFLQNDLNMA